MFVEANSKPQDIAIFTDGSGTRDRSGWGFPVKQVRKTVHENSGAHRVTTPSLTMEVEAVTHVVQWLASKCDAQITHAVILDEPPAIREVWNGLPLLAHSHAVTSATKISVDLVSWACRSQRELAGRQTGKRDRYHIWSVVWQDRGAPRLEEHSEHGQARASQH